MRGMIVPAVLTTVAITAEIGSGQQTDFAPALPRDGATLTFSNDVIDAWDVTWVVGQPTPMHRHTTDYFGVELTASETLLTDPDGGERRISLERGRVWFLRAGVTHAETGLTGDPPRRAIIVEVKEVPPESSAPLADVPTGPVGEARPPAIDNERVSIWDVILPTDAPQAMRFYDRPVVLLFMEDTELEWIESGGPGGRRAFDAGQVLYLPGGTARALRSPAGPAQVIVAELKG